jgi:hypothetical protein
VFTDQPMVAAKPQREGAASYAVTSCSAPNITGFHSSIVSVLGTARTITMPGDSLAFERFIAVGAGPGTSEAINAVTDARAMVFPEDTVTLTATVKHPDGTVVRPEERVGLLFFRREGDARVPLTEAVPDAAGRISVRMRKGQGFSIERHVLGRPRGAPITFGGQESNAALPDIGLDPSGKVKITVTDEDGVAAVSDLVLTPTDESLARSDSTGSLYGAFKVEACNPYLGPPHGGSPACNRVLTSLDGKANFDVPAGSYWMYITRGPFAPLTRERLDIQDGQTIEKTLVLKRVLPMLPNGALSADFHVHGGASFDSSLPDLDRVKSFLAEGVDVLAATDHDLVTNYDAAIQTLGVQDRVRVMPGAETTGHILFARPPGSSVPKVIGHYNFWPLRYDASLPRNGLPWEELKEPGALFDAIRPNFVGTGVIQFNHPVAKATFGRDEGFLSSIGHDPRKPIPAAYEDTQNGQLRKPGPVSTALDYNVQEVMNGTSLLGFLTYRAAWFSFLSQGIVRAGTANSDSHTLAVEVMGFPRNIVLGNHSLPSFDIERFNEDVRKGRMVGTNGPLLLATIDDRPPSTEAFSPKGGAALRITLDAMPWITASEIRIVVNGVVKRTIRDLKPTGDPFGPRTIRLYEGTIAVDELLAGLPADRDAYIVVEAGLPLIAAADLDGDGYVDTTDNNGDGVVNQADRDGLDEADTFVEPKRPKEGDPRYHAHVVAPGHWSTAFTNPFLIDRGPKGFTGPGLP